jgi:hypothetical protein
MGACHERGINHIPHRHMATPSPAAARQSAYVRMCRRPTSLPRAGRATGPGKFNRKIEIALHYLLIPGNRAEIP